MGEQLCRSTDPETSREAAAIMLEPGKQSFMLQVALKVLRENPGSTARELDCFAGFADGSIRKRLRELERRGLAYTEGTRRCRFTGRKVQTWWPRVSSESTARTSQGATNGNGAS